MSRRRQRAEERARFHREEAPSLAREAVSVHATLVPFEVPAGWRASTATSLFVDLEDSVLVVVVSPGEGQATVDLALAHGISFQGDRDLRLVLPQEEGSRFRPTLHRMAWLRPSVRLFVYTPGDLVLTEQIVPPRWIVSGNLRQDESLRLEPHELGPGEVFVRGLVERLEADPRLDAAHRESYRAWHVQGRQVLRLTRGPRGSVKLLAGVGFKERPDWAPEARALTVAEPLSEAVLDELVGLVEPFVQARLDGRDSAGEEHQLQARLNTPEGIEAMGLTGQILREVPCSRPGQRRAYIDLVGVDPWGRIHLVETKVGRDLGVVLQALDYRIWAEAWRSELRAALVELGHVHLSRKPRLIVDVLVATQREAELVAVLAPQVEALDGSIKVRVGIARSWRAGEPLDLRWHSDRSVAARGPHPRFASRLEVARGRLARQAGLLTRTPFLKGPESALPEASLPELRRLVAAGLDHPQLSHLRSSQGFALALFGGLDAERSAQLMRLLEPGVVEAEAPVLEWLDPQDGLQEQTAGSRHQTQADVGLRGVLGDGSRLLVLVEVKLSEDDLNACSAYQASRNDALEACGGEGPWGGSRESCFQLRNHEYKAPDGGHRRRRYDAYVPNTPVDGGGREGVGAGCVFRCSGNQPMRLVALAAQELERGTADRAVVALCAPGSHGAIWRRWEEVTVSMALPEGVSWGRLEASALAGVGRWPPPLWPEGF